MLKRQNMSTFGNVITLDTWNYKFYLNIAHPQFSIMTTLTDISRPTRNWRSSKPHGFAKLRLIFEDILKSAGISIALQHRRFAIPEGLEWIA